jgi:hypothetical protein
VLAGFDPYWPVLERTVAGIKNVGAGPFPSPLVPFGYGGGPFSRLRDVYQYVTADLCQVYTMRESEKLAIEYRKQADFCLSEADRALPDDRRLWEALALELLRLAAARTLR